MADTYTPLLRLTKPGLTTAGWGTLVNNGTFQLIDNAIAGIVDVDVSAGDVTLTTANGTTDQARYMCLRVINGPVSARNVIVPTLSKIYFVINEGAGPIQIRTATGVALAIMPAGSSTVVRVDTSGDVYHAISQLQGLRLIDPLVPTSGGTGLASYAVGDLLYASSTTAISKLTVGATNAVLTVAAGIPAWTPTLGVSSGGTGAATLAANNVLLGNGTSALQVVAPGASGNVLASTGTTWASTAISTLVPAATDTVSGIVELATSAEVQAGTDTTRAVTPATLHAGSLVRGTVQNSTSGTSIDFVGATGIPSWAKRVTIMFSAVGTSGTSSTLIQIGDSGGVETTGYTSYSSFGVSANQFISSTAGFVLDPADYLTSATLRYGSIVLVNVTGNVWVASGNILQDTGVVSNATGGKTLSDVLDRVRVTTVNGTDTFDAGQINIMYE